MAVKRYDGSAWQTVAGLGAQGAAATSSSIATWVKTASGGETSLSGNDDSSQALSYTVGQELVFINGTLLKRGSDYTATNGTSITGLTALAANDVATVWTVNAFSVTGAIANTIVDAKGDLLVGTAADTPGRLAVGTNGQVLTAASTTGTGLAWATPASGLTLVKSQTIGSGVSSITVSDAFNSTYDNYRIIVSGGVASTSNRFNLTLGSTNTGYYRFYIYGQYNSATVTGEQAANTASWSDVAFNTTNSLFGEFDLYMPFLSKNTHLHKFHAESATTGFVFIGGGYLANTTSYTAFTLTVTTGTVTGGEIRVYGYQNSQE